MEAHTAEGAWDRFLQHAARARQKPTFDLEERENRLAAAERLRTLLHAVADDQETPDIGIRFLHAVGSRLNAVIQPKRAEWLRYWEGADGPSLRRSLAGFVAEGDPIARVRAFEAAAAEAIANGPVPDDPSTLILIGSLLNFSLAPQDLPLVHPGRFEELERLLHHPRVPAGSIADQYEHHLSFARRAGELLQAAGVAVRDMLDVQSLISLAVWQRDFWAAGPGNADEERQARGSTARGAYVAVCAVYRNEAAYLREWIEFHRLVGVERFFLYDNYSDDDHVRVLEPYVRDGTVVLHDWSIGPSARAGRSKMSTAQSTAYQDCVERHRDDAEWMTFIDIDEFLFCPAGASLPDALADYEQWSGVAVNWVTFGPSGHRSKPSGLVIEAYDRSLDLPWNRFVKHVVRPHRVARIGTPHNVEYIHQTAVDENHYPVLGPASKSVSVSKLRLNHYYTKSDAEFVARQSAAAGEDGESNSLLTQIRRIEATHSHVDRAIMRYAPAVREALAEKGG